MGEYKWQVKYREYVSNLNNRELYEEFKKIVGEYNNEYSMDNRTEFKYRECKKEFVLRKSLLMFEYRLKQFKFLD